MALSKPTQKDSLCQFCEESAGIQWLCVNCESILCQPCRHKIHGKNKTFSDHVILNLKELGTEEALEKIRKVDLLRMPCNLHNDQKCCVYCTDCDQPICSRCLTKSHQSHKFIELMEAYGAKIADLKNLKGKTDSNIPLFHNEVNKLEHILTEGEREFHATKEKIINQENGMKQAVEKYAKELLQTHDLSWRPLEDKIKEELSSAKETKDELEGTRSILNQALQSQKVSDIFNAVCSTHKALNRESPNQLKLKRTRFIPGNLDHLTQRTFGGLYNVPEIQLVQIFETDLQSVSTILLTTNNVAYISSYKSESVQKVKFENDKMRIQNKVITDVYDMAIMQNGDILISTGGSELKLYGKPKIFKSFSPLETLGIHVNKHNNILLGLTESKTFNMPNKDKKSRVILMNPEGKVLHTYEHDKDNQRLFTLPVRINTLKDGICVVDTLNFKDEGRVVVIEKGGQIQWIYNGCKSTTLTKGEFCPQDVAISNYIFVSDHKNHAIHILTHSGEVIDCVGVKDLGIELPLGFAVDKTGMLWTGCSPTENGKNNAKLHCVKLT